MSNITDYPVNSELTEAEYEEMKKALLEESIAQAEATAKQNYEAILKETNSLTTARLVSGYNPDEV